MKLSSVRVHEVQSWADRLLLDSLGWYCQSVRMVGVQIFGVKMAAVLFAIHCVGCRRKRLPATASVACCLWFATVAIVCVGWLRQCLFVSHYYVGWATSCKVVLLL